MTRHLHAPPFECGRRSRAQSRDNLPAGQAGSTPLFSPAECLSAGSLEGLPIPQASRLDAGEVYFRLRFLPTSVLSVLNPSFRAHTSGIALGQFQVEKASGQIEFHLESVEESVLTEQAKTQALQRSGEPYGNRIGDHGPNAQSQGKEPRRLLGRASPTELIGSPVLQRQPKARRERGGKDNVICSGIHESVAGPFSVPVGQCDRQKRTWCGFPRGERRRGPDFSVGVPNRISGQWPSQDERGVSFRRSDDERRFFPVPLCLFQGFFDRGSFAHNPFLVLRNRHPHARRNAGQQCLIKSLYRRCHRSLPGAPCSRPISPALILPQKRGGKSTLRSLCSPIVNCRLSTVDCAVPVIPCTLGVTK
jgi:hypothetical protein